MNLLDLMDGTVSITYYLKRASNNEDIGSLEQTVTNYIGYLDTSQDSPMDKLAKYSNFIVYAIARDSSNNTCVSNTVNYYHFTCFVKGTLVSTPNGLIPIEEIKEGDTVYSMNLENLEIEETVVERTFKNNVNYEMCKIRLNNELIESTAGHHYLEKSRGWTEAKDLKEGDVLINMSGDENKVLGMELKQYNEGTTVYNLEVEKNHNYFVGNNQVLVHNKGCIALVE